MESHVEKSTKSLKVHGLKDTLLFKITCHIDNSWGIKHTVRRTKFYIVFFSYIRGTFKNITRGFHLDNNIPKNLPFDLLKRTKNPL